MAIVYVTGHRNPDLDSIGSAIGYAELKNRLDHANRYVPVRLGPVNQQTQWALQRSGLEPPEFLPHVRLRVCDVMHPSPALANERDPVRDVGLEMASKGLDLVPVVDAGGALTGVVSERELARLYIRESRGASTFADRPVTLAAINDVLDGEVLVDHEGEVTGRCWVLATDVASLGKLVGEGDIAVVGDRADAQRRALELGIAVLVTSNGQRPDDDVRALAAERGTGVVVSPLDSYVTARLIGLAVPCRAIMSNDPLTVTAEDLVADILERVKDVGYRAAIAVGDDHVPIGIVSREDLVNPQPRRVLLVDHAEQAQSAPGIEEAEIVEILDHHHIGSIETRIPVKATFDPVGSTATLVVERFRREGREPRTQTATMLLSALLSDTVILTSPTTTERDRRVAAYLEELLGVQAHEFGMEMFEASSDVSGLPARDIVSRDAKEYAAASGRRFSIGQIETVGNGVLDRKDELLGALEESRDDRGYDVFALMVTDIVGKGTELLVAGDTPAVERALGVPAHDGTLTLPGVMSRKKQVAPRLLATL